MDHMEVSLILQQLRETSQKLVPSLERYDVAAVEAALAERERVVARFQELVERNPAAFTDADLESARESLRLGKEAHERLLEIRRTGWTTATELSKDEYVLRAIAKYGKNLSSD
jgi:hypothetical protein